MEKQKFNTNEPVHFNVACDGCNKKPIIGNRYKCNNCEDFDFCSDCYKNKISTHNKDHTFNLIEKSNKRWHHRGNGKSECPWRTKCREWRNKNNTNEPIHYRVMCDGCNKGPIIGNRYKCNDCEDFDFCGICYEKLKQFHPQEHSFKVIEKPSCCFKTCNEIEKKSSRRKSSRKKSSRRKT